MKLYSLIQLFLLVFLLSIAESYRVCPKNQVLNSTLGDCQCDDTVITSAGIIGTDKLYCRYDETSSTETKEMVGKPSYLQLCIKNRVPSKTNNCKLAHNPGSKICIKNQYKGSENTCVQLPDQLCETNIIVSSSGCKISEDEGSKICIENQYKSAPGMCTEKKVDCKQNQVLDNSSCNCAKVGELKNIIIAHTCQGNACPPKIHYYCKKALNGDLMKTLVPQNTYCVGGNTQTSVDCKIGVNPGDKICLKTQYIANNQCYGTLPLILSPTPINNFGVNAEVSSGVVDTCSDGKFNEGEDGIDCGGVCPPCKGSLTTTIGIMFAVLIGIFILIGVGVVVWHYHPIITNANSEDDVENPQQPNINNENPQQPNINNENYHTVTLQDHVIDEWDMGLNLSGPWNEWEITFVGDGGQGDRLGIKKGWKIKYVDYKRINQENYLYIKEQLLHGAKSHIGFLLPVDKPQKNSKVVTGTLTVTTPKDVSEEYGATGANGSKAKATSKVVTGTPNVTIAKNVSEKADAARTSNVDKPQETSKVVTGTLTVAITKKNYESLGQL